MKLKRLLATAAVATIASSAVMAEGAYIGSEINKNSIGNEYLTLELEDHKFYVGNEIAITDTLMLDTRVDYTMIDDTSADYFLFSAGLNKEFGNLELYGNLAYINGDYSVSGMSYQMGARYSFK